MKTIRKTLSTIIVGLFMTISLYNCSNFMEFPPASSFNQDSVFMKYTNVQKLVNDLYSYCIPLNFDVRNFGTNGTRMSGGSFASAITDEGQSFHVQPGYHVQQYYVGNVSADFSASWSSSSTYKGEDDYLTKWKTIRKAYVLLENVDRTPDATVAQKERIKAECKLMIATVYFEMFKRYGGVPLIYKAFTGAESEDEINQPRATLQQTYDFINSLLVDVKQNYANSLPANYNSQPEEFGRFPMAMAYALQARLDLYAASPLFNTATPYSNELGENSNLICFMNYDKERWKKAAESAEAAINFCNANGYAVVDNPSERSNGMNYTRANINYPATGNTEVIWGIPQNAAGTNWQMYVMVRTFSGTASGYACNLVPVNQIERWEINDGVTPGQFRDWDTPMSFTTGISPTETDANKAKLQLAQVARTPYEGLDPRFKASVIYNGDENYGEWSLTGEVDMADAFLDSGATIPSKNGTLSEGRYRTTILHYVRKFHRGYEGRYMENTMKPLNIYMRLADLYLMRAEALNEYALASNGTVPAQVHSDLNFIRSRSAMCGVKANATPLEMRDINAHERNIEMYYEDQRWFDLRRTLKSSEKIPVMVYKIQIRKWYANSSDNWPYKITYEKVPYQKRYWADHWYMNPFPKSEINKFYGLIQNPGW